MAKSIYDQLIAAGVDPRDIDHHESDLYVKVTDESSSWLDGYEFKGNVTRFVDDIDHVPYYDVPFAFLDDVIAAKEGERPSPDDLRALALAGLAPGGADVRDEGDVAFTGDWFRIERADADDPEDADRRRARIACYFEPKSVGGVEANWNCCVEVDGDFMSLNGTWPDCFSTSREMLRCVEGYLGDGGMLAERGWKVAGR